MPTIQQSIEECFQAHQARLAAVAAAPGVGGLHPSLSAISATSLSKQIQALVKPQYVSDCAAGTAPEDKIARLAASVANLARQIKPLAPNDAYFEAFTTGSLAAAQEVFYPFSTCLPGRARSHRR